MNQTAFNNSEKYLLTDAIGYAEGSIVSKIVVKNDAGNITLFAFDKGQNLSEHTAPFDAIVQIVEGEAKIRIKDNDFSLHANEMIIMPANVSHSVLAEKRFKMLLTMLKAK
jgi:quercetin dioxygenase-like cupin family protein